jgi:DNA-binding NarL/FixJ family response regulator
MIRVLVVDDEPLVRTGLSVIIDTEPDLEVVGEAADGVAADAAVRRLTPDVVLMDVRMPVLDGIEATVRMTSRPNPPRIIIVTTFEHDDHVLDALRAGADGFLLKRARPEEVVHAIRLVSAGDSLLFPRAIRSLATGLSNKGTHARELASLTEWEGEVLRLVASGLSNSEIADQLVVGVETVKTHVGAILAKLGVRDRTQAVVAAYESGFVGPRI